MSIADLNRLGVRCRPIITWPGAMTNGRRNSPFRASWRQTYRDLAEELRHVHASSIVLELAVAESDITLDGTRPRAGAVARHPGVILSFQSKSGPLRFAVDRFTTWECNIRAIALGMSDLRRIERYGIIRRGEQYAGFRQLPQPDTGEARNVVEALKVLFRLSETPPAKSVTKDDLRSMYRRAAMKHHPDRGGDPAVFAVLAQAWAIVEKEHDL